jgi:multiple sugar transport system ATP-binding protein
MNMLEARVERAGGGVAVVLGDARLELSDHPWLAPYDGQAIVLGIRPEDMEDAAIAGDDVGPRLRGRVELREALGADVLVHFAVAARPAVTEDVRELAEDVGDDRLRSQDAAAATLVGRFSPRTRVVEGDTVEVSVDRNALHFFDPQTGLAIRAR